MTVFDTKLIDSVTQQILHSGVTFESQASVYNALHGENDEKRLGRFAEHFKRVRNADADSYSWKLNGSYTNLFFTIWR